MGAKEATLEVEMLHAMARNVNVDIPYSDQPNSSLGPFRVFVRMNITDTTRIEIWRDSSTKCWLIYSNYFTAEFTKYNISITTIHLILQVLCKRGRLGQNYIDLFEQDNKHHDKKMSFVGYLLKYCLIDNREWRREDNYYILEQEGFLVKFIPGAEIDIKGHGPNMYFEDVSNDVLSSYIKEYADNNN